jgi:uncharacterized protein YdbL (DUF1318 family)
VGQAARLGEFDQKSGIEIECNHGYTDMVGYHTAAGEWVLLSYRLPREPSTPRITLWRKLRKLGVAQLADGVVALPADSRTHEQFEWLAEEVVESGGQAGVWLARPSTAAQERELAAQIANARAAEYSELESAAVAAGVLGASAREGALRRLRAHWRQITRRDFFPPPERERARLALHALATATDEIPRTDAEEVSS